jgi:hypothetical protein
MSIYLAARLQGLAAPDTVVLSTATQRLVAGLFECQDLGPQPLRGCLKSQDIESLRAQRSNLCPKKRLLRRLWLLAMTLFSCFPDTL